MLKNLTNLMQFRFNIYKSKEYTMAKKKVQISYKCSNCGFVQPRWLGRCPECSSWNTLEECITDPNALSSVAPGQIATKVKPVPLSSVVAVGDDR